MSASAKSPHFAAGHRLGRYEICAELAAGGMGTVYLARATGPAGFDKLVALKVVHPRLAREQDFIDMFLDEARIASRITHANVGSVFDVGEAEGTYYLAMDYLHGETLASVLGCIARSPEARASHLYPVHVIAIVAAACEGLHAAHELRGDRGTPLDVVHRDVSPHNIFVTYDGGVRVVDFGIARAGGQLHKTLSGTIKGKVAYMAPEQLRGKELDRRADLWAVGVTLWELLTCRRLFRRESQGKTIDAVLSWPIPLASAYAPHLPLDVDEILAATLSRDPSGRPATARELGRSLRRAIASTGEIVGMAELAEWMEHLFADHREAKRRMIEEARGGGALRSVPDTQRFAQLPQDLVPTAIEERSDVREKARPGMDTLKDGGMGAVSAPNPVETGEPTEAAPPAVTPSDPVPPLSAPSARPAFGTESVVLPVRGTDRPLWLVLILLLLVGAGAAAFGLLHDRNEPETLPQTTAAPSEQPAVAPNDPETAPIEDGDATGTMVDAELTKLPEPAKGPPERIRRDTTPRMVEMAGQVGTGRLSIGVRGGWGTFVVDGAHRGDTPDELTLPAGRHRVVIRPFGEGPPLRRTVTVRPGQTARVTVDAP